MAHPALPIALLALTAPSANAGAAAWNAPRDSDVQVAQLTIHERIIIRVPRLSGPIAATNMRASPPTPVKWKEKKGPKCVGAQTMGGALISAPNQVDLVLIGGKRLRAKLDGDCKPLDFYSGFYLRPSADGMICGGRDAIRVRSGASCGIDGFKTLVATK